LAQFGARGIKELREWRMNVKKQSTRNVIIDVSPEIYLVKNDAARESNNPQMNCSREEVENNSDDVVMRAQRPHHSCEVDDRN
jgi:hypothetical protein